MLFYRMKCLEEINNNLTIAKENIRKSKESETKKKKKLHLALAEAHIAAAVAYTKMYPQLVLGI